MKMLCIGAGSMGNRRIRDLSTLQDIQLALVDKRKDRLEAATERYPITAFEHIESALHWKPDAIVISTPPDVHNPYIEIALENGLHHFCEENIWTYDYKKVGVISDQKRLVSLPSCSLHFLPVIRGLKKIVLEELGTLHTYHMCLSTYEPTWHPSEGNEFYARNRSTSAGREMVPFELVFLNDIFGIPESVAGTVSRRGELGHHVEDTWCLQTKLQNGATGQLTVMMGCEHSMRKGWVAGTKGIVQFDLISGEVVRNFPAAGVNDVIQYGKMKDVLEEAYCEEIHTFVEVIKGNTSWPHSYFMSALATGTLAAAEKSAVTGTIEMVDPGFQPANYPTMYSFQE